MIFIMSAHPSAPLLDQLQQKKRQSKHVFSSIPENPLLFIPDVPEKRHRFILIYIESLQVDKSSNC